MTIALLNSIPYSEIPSYNCGQLKPVTTYFWGTDHRYARSVIETNLQGLIPEFDPDLDSDLAFLFYPLHDVMEYVFNNLEEGQPTFHHEFCKHCKEWMFSEIMTDDGEGAVCCLDCSKRREGEIQDIETRRYLENER